MSGRQVTACEREGDAPDMVCRIPGVQEPRVLDMDAHEDARRFLAGGPHLHGVLEGRAVGEDLPSVLRTRQVRRAPRHSPLPDNGNTT